MHGHGFLMSFQIRLYKSYISYVMYWPEINKVLSYCLDVNFEVTKTFSGCHDCDPEEMFLCPKGKRKWIKDKKVN